MKLRLCLLLGLLAGSLQAQDPDWVRDWDAAQRQRPEHLTSKSRIAPKSEPGDVMVVRGHVFKADGSTPAEGAIVFAYHTDAKGLYNQKGKPGWRLRGWAVTDKSGAYEFTTIRPAPYPSGTVPAHIHLTVEGGGLPRQWTEEFRFADDPRLSKSDIEHSQKEGKFGNVRSVRRDGDTQHVEFDIRSKRVADF